MVGAGFSPHSTTSPAWPSEADVPICPRQSLLALEACLGELVRNRVSVPPHVPVVLQRVDQPEVGGAEELTIDKAEVALPRQWDVPNTHESLLTADVLVVGSRADLHQVQLCTAVPGTSAVSVPSNPLAPVLRTEDHAPAGCGAHDFPFDVVEAGVANQCPLTLPSDINAPEIGAPITPDVVEPLVLALLGWRRLASEVARDLVALHATALNELRHVLSLQRSKLDLELANAKAHDGSEHSSLLSARIRQNDTFALTPV